jgi:tetratricopeptide (TPR) repeat protein
MILIEDSSRTKASLSVRFINSSHSDVHLAPPEVPSPEAISKLEKFVQIPGATAPRRLQLDLAFGDEFRQLVKPYIIRGFEKGIPSLFADLKALYVHKEKHTVIEDIVNSLREDYCHTADATRNKEFDPTTYLWTLYFLAQHYSHLSHHSKALEVLDIAINHTPTLPELYLLRGKVLKRVGDYFGAAKSVNEARMLDGQDRFLNTKCGKYLLRAGMMDESTPIFGLFTKVSFSVFSLHEFFLFMLPRLQKDVPSPPADLQDMQSLLYLLEAADLHRRSGKLNLALKTYMAIKTASRISRLPFLCSGPHLGFRRV